MIVTPRGALRSRSRNGSVVAQWQVVKYGLLTRNRSTRPSKTTMSDKGRLLLLQRATFDPMEHSLTSQTTVVTLEVKSDYRCAPH